MPNLAELQQRLGHQFRDEGLLRLALTHPSVAHERNEVSVHNQRLEFLGDSVLGLVLSRQIYEKFPEADEGALTKSRAKLVNAGALAKHGRALNLGAHLILSRGEETTGGRDRASALADAFEALSGAVFLDGGFVAVQEFILREFAADLLELEEPTGIENPKGELQELLQSRSPVAPEYRLISTSGADHDRDFECAVFHNDVELGRGCGKSKKAAESEAALAVLKKLKEETPV
ncbi:MAG: ribonuclease III [Limisphaerales bacterium]